MRQKHAELESHTKNNIKNSIRLCLQDLASVYHKYGYTGQALTLWEKAFEQSTADEDKKRLSI